MAAENHNIYHCIYTEKIYNKVDVAFERVTHREAKMIDTLVVLLNFELDLELPNNMITILWRKDQEEAKIRQNSTMDDYNK